MSEWSDIGEMLRGEREASGSSLKDVSHRTRIPIQTLHELEENDYTSFPSPAYARSFLSQYSDYLGIDAGDWLEAFDTSNVFSNLDSYDYLKDHDERLGEDLIPAPKAKVKAAPKTAAPAAAPARRSSASMALQPLVVFLVTALLLAGGAFGFLVLSNRLDEAVGGEDQAPNADTPQVTPAPSVVPSRPAPPRHPAPARNPAPAVAGTDDAARPIPAIPVDEDSTPELLRSSPPPRAVIVEE